MRAGFSDHAPDGIALVAVEIVHDDDIARLEGGNQNLLDIGFEAQPVDRPIEDKGSGDAITAQRREKGQRLPVAVRQLGIQRFAPAIPAAPTRHVGLDPGFVDEDQTAGRDPGLVFTPPETPPCDVRPVLFGGVNGFF